ncbi:hypothetical protein SprV_0501828900 [Sparganum proliferum]
MTFTDQTEVFSEIVASKLFPSYELFRQAFEHFTKITGSRFSKDKTSLHRPGTLNRDILVYRSAEFKCSSKCEACFVIGCKKGHLFVTRYHMVHNHDVDFQATSSPEPPQPVVEIPEVSHDHVDLTAQFNAHFPSLTFASYADLMEAMRSFQEETGSVYVKKGVHKLPIGHVNSGLLVYTTMRFQCIHYGNFVSTAQMRQNHRSKKIGCLSTIHVSSTQNKLHITRFNMRHNHLVSPTHVPTRRKDPTSVPLKTPKEYGPHCVRTNDGLCMNRPPLPSSEYFEKVVGVDQSGSEETSPVPTFGACISSYSSLPPFPLPKADYCEKSQRLASVEPMLQCIRKILARQRNGVAMGTPLGPLLADAFMRKLERFQLSDQIKKLKHYGRYVDDIFAIATTETDVAALLNAVNRAHPSIKFTLEMESAGALSFLDVLLNRRCDGNIRTSVYRKKIWSGQYTNFASFVPLQQQRNLVRCLAQRAGTSDRLNVHLLIHLLLWSRLYWSYESAPFQKNKRAPSRMSGKR